MAYAIESTIQPKWQVVFNWVAPRGFYLSRASNCGQPKPMTRNMVPNAAVFSASRKQLPDFALVQAWMVISHRLRSHIEFLEPDRNQYFAFNVARKNGKPVLGPDGNPLNDPYYLINVTTRFDAIIIDQSKIGPPHESGVIYPKIGHLDKIVLDKSLVNGHHVWEGIKHMPGNILISDKLGDWIIANKMKGVELTRLSEE